MSVIRPKPPEDPIPYDPAAVFAAGPVSRAKLDALAGRLDAARAETLADLDRWRSGGAGAGESLDPAFIDLPDRLLADYAANRPESELFAILRTARRVREAVDRVIVLGIGGSFMGTRALFEACCHPFHNELPRGERGGRPRLSFEGFNMDNDSAQGLLDLVAPNGRSRGDDLLDRWGVVVVSKSGGTLETAVATRLLLAALLDAVGGDVQRLAEVVVPITGKTGRLAELARAIGCPETFDIPDGVGGRFSVLTAVGLLPASIVGVDVVRLLEGAAAMNRRFRESPVAENPVLRYVGVCHLAEADGGATIRVLSSWSNRLEAVGLWYDQLLSESLGKAEKGATPLTAVTTRDLHSRGQQHQDGRRDKLITNLVVGEPRRDRIVLPPLGPYAANQDKLDDRVGKTWPEMLAAAVAGTNEAYAGAKRPTADILLPRIDEHVIGQLLQMLMLATVVEGRLVGTNPYGQPGVEQYKQFMMRRLRP
ncbi:MAG: glucose-6-phosphate isomerase [Planctomycetota bacterium]